MHTSALKIMLLALLLCSVTQDLWSDTGRYRLSWREDPATSMTIGFEFSRGKDVYVALGENFGGTDPAAYPIKMSPAVTALIKGMRTCFVRLKGLKPATVYHFIVVDDLGVSSPMSFETPPDRLDRRLSIIAGGDSRNHREARRNTNALVAKLRPHAIFFSGDMTNTDSAQEWQVWLDDWQLTISPDGRLYPIVPARGNHEQDNQSLVELFDLPARDLYYRTSFGGGLLSLYTLNTMISTEGSQLDWLEQELTADRQTIWKMAQYHNAMRPHNSRKQERNDLVRYWAPLFYRFGLDLALESDAHLAKQTYPIRPARGIDADQGFARDDAKGTVYIGEGGWGAPLREADDNKAWTRASGSFNQIKWLWVSANQIEIRTIKTSESTQSGTLQASNRFSVPRGLELWAPTGQYELILRKGANAAVIAPGQPARPPGGINRPPTAGPPPASVVPGGRPVTQPVKSAGILKPDGEYDVQVEFTTTQNGPVEVIVITSEMKLFHKLQLPVRGPGPYREKIDLPEIPRGVRWELVIKSGGQVVRKYQLHN